ncbi:MAG: hypothetical protein K1X64_07600 [Myxococcaceae bacterium]|nr:hypothetical protein [Myxococcaceae bacterium]
MTALLLACAHCAQSAPPSGLRQLAIVLMVLTPFVVAGVVTWQLARSVKAE